MPQNTQQTSTTQIDGDSYGEIIKSSATIGGSTVLNILIGVVRTKVMAVLLGPAGFGLFGVYWSVANLARTAAGMGINSSGVRQIAQAAGLNDVQCIARTTTTLRRISILLGVLGTALLIIFSRPIATVTFGNDQNHSAIVLLSVSVFFQLVSDGQSALLQGMRRILDLARSNVLGAIFGTLTSIALVYFLREKGIVPAIVVVSFISFLFSWKFSHKLQIQATHLSGAQMREEASALMKLGFAFVASTMATLGTGYLIRIIILHRIGYEATGFYQAAWTLGGLYVNVILEAMGTDFYPRLTAHAHDNALCNRLINEQIHVGLLLAGPGVLATLTLSPLLIPIFYSAKFVAVVGVLRWMCLGTLLQVATWPLSYMIAAKGRQAVFFQTELVLCLIDVALAWYCVQAFGLIGVGFAFFASRVLFGFLLLPVAQKISHFKWSAENKVIGLSFLCLNGIVFAGFYLLPLIWAGCLGAFTIAVCGIYSLRTVAKLVSISRLPVPLQWMLITFKLA
jgi:antigen flippase